MRAVTIKASEGPLPLDYPAGLHGKRKKRKHRLYDFTSFHPGFSATLVRKVMISFRQYAHRHGWRTMTRKMPNGNYRCWRVA